MAQDIDAEDARLVALLDVDAAFRVAGARLPAITGLEEVVIGRVEEDAGAGHLALIHPVSRIPGVQQPSALDGLRVPAGRGLGGRVLMSGEPHRVADYCRSHTITHDFDSCARAEGLRGVVAVPVIGGGRVFGVLYCASRSRLWFGDRVIEAMREEAQRVANAALVAERSQHTAEVAVQEERHRLALEMHGTVGAMLFAIGAGARRLTDDPTLPLEARHRLSAITQQATDATDALRRSLRSLHTPTAALALDVALRADCRSFEQRTGIRARLIDLTDVPDLLPARTEALIHAVREALLNVEKHAGARSVVVTVAARPLGVSVVVVDDGAGLASGHRPLDPWAQERGGLGLAGATENLERLGGGLSVGDNDEGGATLRAWVPV